MGKKKIGDSEKLIVFSSLEHKSQHAQGQLSYMVSRHEYENLCSAGVGLIKESISLSQDSLKSALDITRILKTLKSTSSKSIGIESELIEVARKLTCTSEGLADAARLYLNTTKTDIIQDKSYGRRDKTIGLADDLISDEFKKWRAEQKAKNNNQEVTL